MSKNKKNGSKGAAAMVATAVASAIVKTMDGDEVASATALTLSREALIERQKASSRGSRLATVIHNLVATLDGKGPDVFAVASAETPKAKAFAAALAGVKGKEALFTSLEAARASYEAHKASRSEKVAEREKSTIEKAAEVRKQIDAAALKKGEEKRKRAEAESAAVEALEAFVDPDVVQAKEDEKSKRDELHAHRISRLEPLAHGLAVVVLDQGRPVALRATTDEGGPFEVPVVNFTDLRSFGEGQEPAKIPVACSVCDSEMELGQMLPSRKDGDKPAFAVRQVGFLARTPDGQNVWSYRKGPRDGQPRPQNVLVCRTCAKIAMGMSPKVIGERDGQKVEQPAIWARDIYPTFVEWLEGPSSTQHFTGQFGSKDEPVMAQGRAEPLKAGIGEALQAAAAASGERDSDK